MARWRAVAVAALVVLAGCGAIFPSGGGEQATPTETLTPVPITPGGATPTPERNISQYPGVGPDGFAAPRELVRSHVRTLSNRSYTLVWSRSVVDESGEIAQVGRSFRQVARVESNSTFLWRKSGQMVLGNETTYVDPDGRFVRRVGPNGSVMTDLVRAEPVSTDPRRFFAETVRITLLNILDKSVEIDVVERQGRRYVRFQSNSRPQLLAEVFDSYLVRNYTATVYVTDGYVRSLYFTYDLKRGNRSAHVERRYIYRDVGSTEVTRPRWVAALEAAANVTATASETPPTTATASEPPSTTATASEPSSTAASNGTTATPRPDPETTPVSD